MREYIDNGLVYCNECDHWLAGEFIGPYCRLEYENKTSEGTQYNRPYRYVKFDKDATEIKNKDNNCPDFEPSRDALRYKPFLMRYCKKSTKDTIIRILWRRR